MDIAETLHCLRRYCEERNFAGWDPYDAQNSPLMPVLSLGTKYGRIAWTQLVRRSPVNLRPLLLIPKGHNQKGLGLFLSGYVKLYKVEGNEGYIATSRKLIELLRQCCSKGYSGNGWGYNFPWQSRAFRIPPYTPTIVNSVFIGHALLDASALPGLEDARELALSIGDFIAQDLNRHEEDGTLCFSYTPIDRYFVHNANLLGASLLVRIYGETGKLNLLELAKKSIAYSMKYQHSDGSWFYSEWEKAHWVDSYHTGFNLQAIKCFLDAGLETQYQAAFDKGVAFYRDNFFLPDGTPKHYHDKTYPIDIHSPAQAIAFFSGMGTEFDELVERELGWMLNNMLSPHGYFYFQKQKHFTSRISYMRWTQSWVFHALTSYLFNRANSGKRSL